MGALTTSAAIAFAVRSAQRSPARLLAAPPRRKYGGCANNTAHEASMFEKAAPPPLAERILQQAQDEAAVRRSRLRHCAQIQIATSRKSLASLSASSTATLITVPRTRASTTPQVCEREVQETRWQEDNGVLHRRLQHHRLKHAGLAANMALLGPARSTTAPRPLLYEAGVSTMAVAERNCARRKAAWCQWFGQV